MPIPLNNGIELLGIGGFTQKMYTAMVTGYRLSPVWSVKIDTMINWSVCIDGMGYNDFNVFKVKESDEQKSNVFSRDSVCFSVWSCIAH